MRAVGPGLAYRPRGRYGHAGGGGEAGVLVGRTPLLRRPRRGGRGIKRGWSDLKPRCPHYGLVTYRGESEDYWLGGYTGHFIAAEIVRPLLASWPAVNCGLVTAVGAAAAILMPLLFFPFSRSTSGRIPRCAGTATGAIVK